MGLTSYSVFNSKEVTDYLTNNIQPIVGKKSPIRQNNIDLAIARLSKMVEHSKTKEKEAYSLFGVSDLRQFQQKLDTLNKSGLLAFSNKALRHFPAIKNIRKEEAIFTKEDEKRIQNEFKEFLKETSGKDALKYSGLDDQQILGIFSNLLEKSGIEVDRNSISVARTAKRRDFSHILFQDFNKTQKKKLKNFTIETNTQESETSQSTKIIIEIENNNELQTDQKLNYYPYYGLSQEEKEEVKKNEVLWNKFVKAVGQCAPMISSQVEDAMRNMGKAAFINAGGSYADIVGVFGELQALVFLRSFNISSNRVKYFANDTNNQGQKIGIDMALEDIGFQVKNYYSYGAPGQNEGINLRGTYKLNTFLDMLSDNPVVGGNKEEIEMFYALSAFHIAIHENFMPVEHWMDVIKTENLPNLYNAAVAEILPVKQISWINEEMGELSGQNYFYIIGGTRILPVSYILNLYVLFLKDLKNNLYNRRLISSHISKYKGKNYKDYALDTENFNFDGYDEIANGLSINYTLNLNIDYALQQVLTKINKEGLEI